MSTKMAQSRTTRMSLSLLFLLFQITFVNATGLTITGLDVASLAGDKLQIQLEMSGGAAVAPKVFQTDNPARIALDFPGVANGLDKKMYPINQGAISSIYIAEAADRVRVVINLIESAPFDTKVEGNKVLLSLTNAHARSATTAMPVANRPFIKKSTPSTVA